MSDTILIPMAGQGQRFAAESYKIAKPLIEVSGKPMVIQAVNALPKATSYTFICRREHLESGDLEEVLKDKFPNVQIIAIDYLTEGQASTCLLAENYVDKEGALLIGPCDNGMTWDAEKYRRLISDENVDALIWTFRNNVTVKRNPQMYGWVKVDGNNKVSSILCKTPISDDPVKDHAIVGTFYFRKASYFFDFAKQMIKKNRRINNEFYVDVVMNELVESGLNVKVFEIDKYVCWGTPNDLRTYEYWQSFFHKCEWHSYILEKDPMMFAAAIPALNRRYNDFSQEYR